MGSHPPSVNARNLSTKYIVLKREICPGGSRTVKRPHISASRRETHGGPFEHRERPGHISPEDYFRLSRNPAPRIYLSRATTSATSARSSAAPERVYITSSVAWDEVAPPSRFASGGTSDSSTNSDCRITRLPAITSSIPASKWC